MATYYVKRDSIQAIQYTGDNEEEIKAFFKYTLEESIVNFLKTLFDL